MEYSFTTMLVQQTFCIRGVGLCQRLEEMKVFWIKFHSVKNFPWNKLSQLMSFCWWRMDKWDSGNASGLGGGLLLK